MPSAFLQQFEQTAMPMLEDRHGIAVTFYAGTRATAEITALGHDREYMAIELQTGLPIKVVSRDWLIPAASLVINGAAVVPRAGNRIVEGTDEYEIVPVAGKPAVELQEGGYRYLCHSQRVTT